PALTQTAFFPRPSTPALDLSLRFEPVKALHKLEGVGIDETHQPIAVGGASANGKPVRGRQIGVGLHRVEPPNHPRSADRDLATSDWNNAVNVRGLRSDLRQHDIITVTPFVSDLENGSGNR